MPDLRTLERESAGYLSLREIGFLLGISSSRVQQFEQEGRFSGRTWHDVLIFAFDRGIEQAQQVQRQSARVVREIGLRPKSRWYELVALATQVEKLAESVRASRVILRGKVGVRKFAEEEAARGVVWKSLLDTYEVSNDGRVRHARFKRELSQHKAGRTKYPQVTLKLAGGEQRHVLVHRAVLEAFVGVCPEGHQARHLDGDESNNYLANLAWGTPKENAEDKRRHGRQPRGEDMEHAKLTPEIVRLIRASSETQRVLAKKYGVSQTTIGQVRRGQTWAHV